MNYTLFYKMIKEAQDSPAVSPTPAVSNATPENAAPMPMSGFGGPTVDVRPSDPNAPAVPTQNTLTADQLAGKWIKDKESFYRSKATKYPQYTNWTMSVSNQNKLREQAQKMLDADRNAAWDAYKNQKDYSGSDGFRFATTQRYESLPSVQARRQAEEAQKAQQVAMQNPTSDAAINNPTITPVSTATDFEQDPYKSNYPVQPARNLGEAQQRSFEFVQKYGWNSDSTSSLQRAYRNYMHRVLRELYPNLPEYLLLGAFDSDLSDQGLGSQWGPAGEFVSRVNAVPYNSMHSEQLSGYTNKSGDVLYPQPNPTIPTSN